MLTGIFFVWIITAVGLAIVTWIVPGVKVSSISGLFWAAFVLGLVNAFIRPLLWLLTLPLTVLTFGLFALFVNAFTLWLTSKMVSNFEINHFGSALLAALLMALLGVIGFILFNWMMLGEVHWTVQTSSPMRY
ncbi:MAG: phage holin family protein [Pseudomonadales bacterium]|nr:phage holin family protein [Pseudomonadales bacterium]